MVFTRKIVQTTYLISKSLSRSNLVKPKYITTSSVNLSSEQRLYTDKHEWVSVSGDIGTVGISHYAQEALGDIVFAQLPDVGKKLSIKEECGALESVKAASELYSPVSGEVVEKNSEVEDQPALINSNCYDKGWLFKVKLSDRDELKKLMDEQKYSEFLKTDDAH
ncbi:glycine cleavage system H protein [Condylostylus longicornis]|uniref:glycine cleavage system H protein n=1 Tax=Condylostylus longicornis TaxID=2530218 RepID=UPI00244E33E3|nr:glycine cleavage system H protein [Condylostylus longicornis]